MTGTAIKKKYEAVVSMDDDYFLNCVLELEPLIDAGWYMQAVERDSELNTMFVTLEKENIQRSGERVFC